MRLTTSRTTRHEHHAQTAAPATASCRGSPFDRAAFAAIGHSCSDRSAYLFARDLVINRGQSVEYGSERRSPNLGRGVSPA